MEYRKLFLGAASVLALTAATETAKASIPRGSEPGQTTSSAAQHAFNDPLLDFVARTGGSLSVESVEATLGGMFDILSPAQAERLPAFLSDIAMLGLPDDVVDVARSFLLSKVANAGLTKEAYDRIEAGLLQPSLSYSLAKRTAKDLDDCDPDSPRYDKDDPNCAPDETGTIGDSPQGGGGYN